MESRVKSIAIEGIEKRLRPTKHYVYILQVEVTDNMHYRIRRRYKHFLKLQIKLCVRFPVESGSSNKTERIIPFIPGKAARGKNHLRSTAISRLTSLEEFCKELLKLPEKISHCPEVKEFFTPDSQDILSPGAENGNSINPLLIATNDLRQEQIDATVKSNEFLVTDDFIPSVEDTGRIRLRRGERAEVLEKSDTGWWYVEAESGHGWAPASCLEDPPEELQGDETKIYAVPGQPGKPYIATRCYGAQANDELSFRRGIEVTILEKRSNGWWLAEYNGRVGLVPGCHLARKSCARSIRLLRQLAAATPDQRNSGSSSSNGATPPTLAEERVSDVTPGSVTQLAKSKPPVQPRNKPTLSIAPPEMQRVVPLYSVPQSTSASSSNGVTSRSSLCLDGPISSLSFAAAPSPRSAIPQLPEPVSVSPLSGGFALSSSLAHPSDTIICEEVIESAVDLESSSDEEQLLPSGVVVDPPPRKPSARQKSPSRAPRSPQQEEEEQEEVAREKQVNRAVRDYEAVALGSISLREGQEVQVLPREPSDGWLAVRVDGRQGYVPKEFIAAANVPTPKPRLKAKQRLAFEVVQKALWSDEASLGESLLNTIRVEGSFMIRKSVTAANQQTLLVYKETGIIKYVIKQNEEKRFYLAKSAPSFSSLGELISFYRENCLPKTRIKLGAPYKNLAS